jgi:colanic acid biosynthesis glycosyl transferase WcaI
MMAAADVGLVTLNPSAALSSLPSKVFNIMASARPILAVAPPDSDLARLVEGGGCGLTIPTGQPERLAEAILRLKQPGEGASEMGRRGRSLLETCYSRRQCVEQYACMLENLRPAPATRGETGAA